MANKRALKRMINNDLGSLIISVYDWEVAHAKKDQKASEAVIDQAIATFDELVTRVNMRKVENPAKHFKAIRNDLGIRVKALEAQIEAL